MFVTFEGTEGCGKSVQAKALASYLEESGRSVVLTREPGGTRVGEMIRRVLLDKGDLTMSAVAETLLFSAARAEHVAEVILPALQAGKTVVSDRFADSTLAYQAFGRGLDRRTVEMVLRFATGGLRPDLTILLDLEPAEGLRRKAGELPDRIERMDMPFHRRVREGYLLLAAEEPQRWRVVNGQQPVTEIAEQIRLLFEDQRTVEGARGANG